MPGKKTGLGTDPLTDIERVIHKILTPPARPQRTPSVQSTQSTPSENGCKSGYTRKTFHVSKAQLEKIEALAYWERFDIKEIVEQAFDAYLKGKRVKPIPKR